MPRALSSSASAGRATSAPSERAPLAPAGSSGPKYFKPERSAGRATVLIVGGVIVVALLLVLATSVFKGGGSPTTATQGPAAGEAPVVSSHTGTPAKAANPADTSVVVLNGTSTQGLAHHLAADLQQSGYTLAAAASAVPPGTHPSTVVEYARGHRADAQAIAKTLNVTQVQAAEAATASLAGAANVIVLAGADQAALLGGGGAQSKGEPVGSVESGETAVAGPVAVGRTPTVTTGADEARAVAMGAGATEGAAGAGQ